MKDFILMSIFLILGAFLGCVAAYYTITKTLPRYHVTSGSRLSSECLVAFCAVDIQQALDSGGLAMGIVDKPVKLVSEISLTHFDSDITEPYDIQPALGYRVYQPTYNSQMVGENR